MCPLPARICVGNKCDSPRLLHLAGERVGSSFTIEVAGHAFVSRTTRAAGSRLADELTVLSGTAEVHKLEVGLESRLSLTKGDDGPAEPDLHLHNLRFRST